jgi:hypothetical protein
MINPSLITLLAVVICAWLTFASMDSCVLGNHFALGLIHLLTPASLYASLFFRSTRLRPHYTSLKLLLGALASPPIGNSLYNPHTTR